MDKFNRLLGLRDRVLSLGDGVLSLGGQGAEPRGAVCMGVRVLSLANLPCGTCHQKVVHWQPSDRLPHRFIEIKLVFYYRVYCLFYLAVCRLWYYETMIAI